MQQTKQINLLALTEKTLELASQYGATAAELSLMISDGFTSSVRMSEVDSIEYELGHEADITVYFGQRKGSANTTDIRLSALDSMVKAACDIAKFTGEDNCNGLVEKSLLATQIPDLDLYHPWTLTAKQGIELALECEDYARSLDKRITNSDGVSVSSFNNHYVKANSEGFLAEMKTTRHDITAVLISSTDNGEMERDYYYSVARDPNDLLSIEEVGSQAVARTVSHLGAKKIKTCKVPVVFCPEIARGFLGHFMSAISGGNLYRKSSFLLDSLGKHIFSPWVNIYEDPYLPKALGSSAFDADGVTTVKKDFVNSGELKSYSLGIYAARKLGMPTTANAGGAHNLIIEPGDFTQQQLLKRMNKGLLITEVMGQGVNIVTGDYSRGARGFWVENGEIQYPVTEITIAGNLRDMFANLVAAGNDIDTRGNIRSGSLLLEQMTVAGN